MTIKNYIFENVRLDENKYGGFKTEGEIYCDANNIRMRFVFRVNNDGATINVTPVSPVANSDPDTLCRFIKVIAAKMIK